MDNLAVTFLLSRHKSFLPHVINFGSKTCFLKSWCRGKQKAQWEITARGQQEKEMKGMDPPQRGLE